MNFAFFAAIIVCTIEGVIGTFLNLWLFYSLVRSKRSLMDNMYRVPIYVSSIQNLMLSFLIATMNFVHIFRDGTFVTAMFGPLAQMLPREVSVVVFQFALVLTSMMWSLIPVTATLQLIGLSRVSWPFWQRISVSFVFTTICVIDVAVLSSGFAPTREFAVILEEIARDLYGLDKQSHVAVAGSTATHTELNDDRSLMTLLLYLVLATYTLSYGFFVSLVVLIRRRLKAYGVTLSERTMRLQRAFQKMQLLQGFLPLAIISIPATVFAIGSIAQTNMDFVTLLLTFFLWICPSVQAGVQLRFVRQSASRTPDSTKTGATSTRRRDSLGSPSRRGSDR